MDFQGLLKTFGYIFFVIFFLNDKILIFFFKKKNRNKLLQIKIWTFQLKDNFLHNIDVMKLQRFIFFSIKKN